MHTWRNFSDYTSHILTRRQFLFVAYHADISAVGKAEWNGQARSARGHLSILKKILGKFYVMLGTDGLLEQYKNHTAIGSNKTYTTALVGMDEEAVKYWPRCYLWMLFSPTECFRNALAITKGNSIQRSQTMFIHYYPPHLTNNL